MKNTGIVILCAGKGSRLKSSKPKIFLEIGGKPIISHIINTAKSLHPHKIIAVTSPNLEDQLRHLHPDITICVQDPPKGTADALSCALPELHDTQNVLTLLGDVPLITQSILEDSLKSLQNDLSLLTFHTDNPTGYGRIIRDNQEIIAIREEKDASIDEKKITECFSGILAAKQSFLKNYLPQITNQNAQQEFYLTSLAQLAITKIDSSLGDYRYLRGINTLSQRAIIERFYQIEQAEKLMQNGVEIADPNRIDIRGQVSIEQDTFIDINVIVENSSIGKNCRIGANAIISNSTIADHSVILPGSIISGSNIGQFAQIGPFSHLRADVFTEEHVHIGNFVEVKSSYIRQGSKAKHLTYLGNANIGQKVNIGAGTITCNYDGKNKHQTIIGANSFIGSNSALIAPLNIGQNVLIAAGSTVTDDVSSNSKVFARARQITKVKQEEI